VQNSLTQLGPTNARAWHLVHAEHPSGLSPPARGTVGGDMQVARPAGISAARRSGRSRRDRGSTSNTWDST